MIEEIETILQKILQPVTVKVLITSLRSMGIFNKYKNYRNRTFCWNFKSGCH